jgi:hypothetical protein
MESIAVAFSYLPGCGFRYKLLDYPEPVCTCRGRIYSHTFPQHLTRALVFPTDATWQQLPSSGASGLTFSAGLHRVWAPLAVGAAVGVVADPARPSWPPHMPSSSTAAPTFRAVPVASVPCVSPGACACVSASLAVWSAPSPSMLAIRVCEPASACHRMVLVCPNVESDSEDDLCLCDDPRSSCCGAPALVLPGGSNSEDEVWLCLDPFLACLWAATYTCSVLWDREAGAVSVKRDSRLICFP